MMTQRDFEALAEALGKASNVQDAIGRVTDVCDQANGYFDRQRFLAAVGKARANAYGECAVCHAAHDFPHSLTCSLAGRVVGDKVR